MTARKLGWYSNSEITTKTVATGETVYVGRIVILSTADTVLVAATAAVNWYGACVDVIYRGKYTTFPDGSLIVPTTASAGDAVSIALNGRVCLQYDGTVAVGEQVETYTGGLVHTVTPTSATVLGTVVGVVESVEDATNKYAVVLLARS